MDFDHKWSGVEKRLKDKKFGRPSKYTGFEMEPIHSFFPKYNSSIFNRTHPNKTLRSHIKSGSNSTIKNNNRDLLLEYEFPCLQKYNTKDKTYNDCSEPFTKAQIFRNRLNYNIIYNIGEYISELDKYKQYLLAILDGDDYKYAFVNWLEPKINSEWKKNVSVIRPNDIKKASVIRPKNIKKKKKYFTTPYMVFYQENFKFIWGELGGTGPVTEVAKVVAETWKGLSDEDRYEYRKLSETLKNSSYE